MELKVWVDSALRVVCGLSINTSCQEVVIALAQDIGQTGRYVLILRHHGSEKQLLKDDCPLKELASLGQQARDAHFILRRTGPTLALDPHTDRHHTRTRTPDPQPPKHNDLQDDSGHSTFPRRAKNKTKTRTAIASVEKEAVFVQLLQQTRALQDLEKDLEIVDKKMQDSEQVYGSNRDLRDQLEVLEERQRLNEEELEQEHFWREQLDEETHRAQDLSRRLEQLQWSVHHQNQRMDELGSRTEGLQGDVRTLTDQALRPLEQELHQRHLQGDKITAALEKTEQKIQNTENRVKMQRELLEELSKDLRQCNLQQFIQQASGSAPSDLTNLLPSSDLYLSTAGILE